jgi:hypothetical protein
MNEEQPMRTLPTRLTAVTVAATVAMALLPSLASADEAAPPRAEPALASVRAATATYHDIEVALADGFVQASDCVDSPEGGMGYHYLNPARLDTELVLDEPEVLLYERGRDGRLRLTGVEYLVMDADGDPESLEHHVLAGQHLHGPKIGPIPAHYLLHVWIWKHNPSGTFADWNPRVTC